MLHVMNKSRILCALILTSCITSDTRSSDVPHETFLLKGDHLQDELAGSSGVSKDFLFAQPMRSVTVELAQAVDQPFGDIVGQSTLDTILLESGGISGRVSAGKGNPHENGTTPIRTLILRATEENPGSKSELEEDLSIMSRIFTKTMQEQGFEDDVVTAMGIKIRTMHIANTDSSAVFFENLYLDGYGALFMIRVRFPLLPSPEITRDGESDKPENTKWEETKRELYGRKRTVGRLGTIAWNVHKQPEEYSRKKVAKLRETLLQALRNATNIRNLDSDEFVSIAVVGQNSTLPKLNVAYRTVGDDPTNRSFLVLGNKTLLEPTLGRTTMTLRAKKSDVDAFARGELELEEFEKKVAVAVY